MEVNEYTLAEIVYTVMAELTASEEGYTFSSYDDAAPAAEFATDFCKRHDLGNVRPEWPSFLPDVPPGDDLATDPA